LADILLLRFDCRCRFVCRHHHVRVRHRSCGGKGLLEECEQLVELAVEFLLLLVPLLF
jgi:hypothetical protein